MFKQETNNQTIKDDNMMLKNMFAEQDLIRLTSEYSNILSKKNNTIILLGEDANIIYTFLKNGILNTKDDGFGWEFDLNSPRNNETNMDISLSEHQEQKLTICSSNYLNKNNSSLQLALNAFFLQKILNTAPTKFVLTIKDIDIKNSRSEENIIKIKKFSNILKEFTDLLDNINLNNSNLSIVFTEATPQRNKKHIANIINEALNIGEFSETQKFVIEKLKHSIFLFPTASKQISNYKGLWKILNDKNDSYITPNENNKITINNSHSQYILDSINTINNQIALNINDLRMEMGTKWEQDKATIFNITDSSEINKLAQLIKIFKDSQNESNRGKTTENFLKITKELYSILPISEPDNNLEKLVNNLKYFTNIKLNSSANLEKFQPKAWFDNLFQNVGGYSINGELIKSFLHKIGKDESSFCNKLNNEIQNFCTKITNSKTSSIDEINNIFKLQEFLEKMKNANIKSLDNIKITLKSNFQLLSISPNNDIYKTIDNLQKLIGNIDPKSAESLWDYIKNCESIKKIDQNFYEIVYPKLLYFIISPPQEISTYNKLENLLKKAHDFVGYNQEEEQFYKTQLAEIYCQKAQISTINEAIKLYKQAQSLGSVTATIRLGDIELHNKNYSKALEYFQKTTAISKASETFELLFKAKKSDIETELKQGNTQNIVKLCSELTKLCPKQKEFYENYGDTNSSREVQKELQAVYLDSIAAIAKIGGHANYAILYCLYRNLSEIYSGRDYQIKFANKAAEYKKLHHAFYGTEDEIPYNLIYHNSINKFDDINNNTASYDPAKPFYNRGLDCLGDNYDLWN